jgi:predicted RNase H-like nuclease
LGFHRAGYPLHTTSLAPPGLIEVYPHPALIELTGRPKRLPYKAAKVRRYWPALSSVERQMRLYAEWRDIVIRLDTEISGVTAALPELSPEARGFEAKAYEDMLDAVVCAWGGVRALQGRARAFGNEQSAIWIPTRS